MAETERYLCRDCEHQWVSADPICMFCLRVTPRQGGAGLFDPVHVTNPFNLGMGHTHFEAIGI